MGSSSASVAKYRNAFHLHDEQLHGLMPANTPKKSLFSVVTGGTAKEVSGISSAGQEPARQWPSRLGGAVSTNQLNKSGGQQGDVRPVFRIAAFGMPAKFQRLVEIVVRHAKHNPFKFVLATSRGPSEFDIAMVDMTVRGGPEVAGTLRKLPEAKAVVMVGRRGDNARLKDDLLLGNFTLNLLKALNKVVEESILKRTKAAMPNIPGWSNSDAANNPIKWQQVDGQRKPRVLIVDDSPSVRRQLSLALQHMGVDSEGVGAAQEALDVLVNRRYDLIFVDVMMPEIDGYKLTRLIKKDKLLKRTPIIILTSRSSPFDLARGALAGCNSYLVKPVSLQSLRSTVSRHLLKTIEVQQFGSVRLSPI